MTTKSQDKRTAIQQGREPRRIVITLPLPSRTLHPNARPHWRVLAAAKKKAREDAWLAAYHAMSPELHKSLEESPMKRATVQATFYKRTRHVSDRDGALSSIKAALDGIADAGVIHNDSGFDDKNDPRCEITITEIL
jgi:hypothetical protein